MAPRRQGGKSITLVLSERQIAALEERAQGQQASVSAVAREVFDLGLPQYDKVNRLRAAAAAVA